MTASEQKWTISVTNTFLNELLNVPSEVQKRITRAIRVLEKDPISAQGDAKKLKEFKNNVYRIRLGAYRLIYSFGQGWVKLISIRKRDKSTYEQELPEFVSPSQIPDAEALEPLVNEGATGNYAPQPAALEPREALPFALTAELLGRWQIPQEYWPTLEGAQDVESLLTFTIPEVYLRRVVDNLYPSPVEEIEQQPEYLLREVEDLDRFVEGNIIAFLLKLDPEQERLRDWGGSGPLLVKGGPGTGKSTLALHRVQRLVDQGRVPVLFTTYTNALVTYSHQLLEQLLGRTPEEVGVEVSTVDLVAYRAYEQRFGTPQIIGEDQSKTILEQALREANIPGRTPNDRQTRRRTLEALGVDYLHEEIREVIEAWNLQTMGQYLNFERRGRGTALKASVREAFWAMYQFWREQLARRRWLSWEQLHASVLDAALQSKQKPYRTLVIDEAQDLPPVKLRSLLAQIESLEDVYLTADGSQSLYQRGFSWKQVHEDLKVAGRTLVLKRNYRNTVEIAKACQALMEASGTADRESLLQLPSSYHGDQPSLLLSDDLDTALSAVCTYLHNAARRFRLPVHAACVLCPSTRLAAGISERLTAHGIEARFVSRKDIDLRGSYVKVMTLHAAKGLEFPFVVIAGLEEGMLPRIEPNLPEAELPVLLAQQSRLLYVGCSRAMRALLIWGSVQRPSPFLPFLSEEYWSRFSPE